jgi:hypothetical protein
MPNGRQQYFNDAGALLAGGKIYTYAAGTTTPKATYTTAAATVENANPVVLDARGEAAIFWDGSYYVEVKDADGVLIYSVDNYSDPEQAADVLRSDLEASTGATHVTHGTQTVAQKLDDLTSGKEDALGYVPVNQAGGTVLSETADFGTTQSDALNSRSTGGASYSAIVQFERAGLYGIKLGLNTSNTFGLGGWSQGLDTYRWTSDSSGNFTALGNVTAYSDMRFKTEIVLLKDATERVMQMRGFRYLDERTGERKIGVGAQEVVKAGFPEAVVTDEQGFLSVAYGQLALAALIEVTREMDARIKALETQMKG